MREREYRERERERARVSRERDSIERDYRESIERESIESIEREYWERESEGVGFKRSDCVCFFLSPSLCGREGAWNFVLSPFLHTLALKLLFASLSFPSGSQLS